jgi:hypothetical protein
MEIASLVKSGEVTVPSPKPEVNLHYHTFFSFNANGWSPSRIAWESQKYGLEVAGIVDFDVLDGTVEFLEAGRLLGLKTTAGFETRVFIPEYHDRVINSPKEPGVYYLVGTGFVSSPASGTPAGRTLGDMAGRARQRNLAMVAKINGCLDPVRLDYEHDVLPLTAAGNATERHMLAAYEEKAQQVFPDEAARAEFWSQKLGDPVEKVRAALGNSPAFRDLIRSRLMKHGGVGYAQPEAGSFPPIEDVNRMTLSEGAVPSGCWLDGTSAGEADPRAHFAFLRDKGCVTITIIPDRNWDVPESERALKVGKLDEAIAAARSLDLPVLVGTEMNKFGNKFVDGFDSPAMAPHLEEFRRGAHIVWAHTLLKMTARVGYTGRWADQHFGGRTRDKNEFFQRIGAAPYPSEDVVRELVKLGPDAEPEAIPTAMGLWGWRHDGTCGSSRLFLTHSLTPHKISFVAGADRGHGSDSTESRYAQRRGKDGRAK